MVNPAAPEPSPAPGTAPAPAAPASAPAGTWSRERRTPVRSVALHLTLIAASIVSVFPVAWLVLTSLKPRTVIETASVAPVDHPTLANYAQVLGRPGS